MATISIVIVNYNSGNHLPSCLDSLLGQTFRDFEIIIVDNGSIDGSLRHLDGYPGITLIVNGANRGFAAGQNQGIAASQGRYILSLNFDLILDPRFLEELLGALERCPSAGSASGKLLNMDVDGTALNTIYAAGHKLSPNRFAFLRGHMEPDLGQYNQPVEVFGAPGAAALYRREMITDICLSEQFFDEKLFTWYEDVDVDWRAQQLGWRCLYVPTAVGHHIGHCGEDYEEPFRSWRTRLVIRNRWLVIAANESCQGLRKHGGSMARYEIANLFFILRTGQLAAYLGAFCDFLRSAGYVRAKRQWIRCHQDERQPPNG